MTFHWGADLLEETAGLDVLGVRGIDQSIELAMVNGITTISQRGRYLALLPWALGEFLSANAASGFEWDALTKHLRRVEFVVLAATRMDVAINKGDPTGTIGADLHAEALASLLGGKNVVLPEDKGGSILGTYLSPCRALGLLKDSTEGVPYKLTPRGRAVWEARNAQPGIQEVAATLVAGGTLTPALTRQAIPAFSLNALASSPGEAAILRQMLSEPWAPGEPSEKAFVDAAYDALNGTVAWAKGMLVDKPDTAAGLLIRNYQHCVGGAAADRVSLAWAEYEHRRRCHFALEMVLSALTQELAAVDEAGIYDIVERWAEAESAAPALLRIWPAAAVAWSRTSVEAARSVPADLLLGGTIPAKDLGRMLPAAQALAAFAILAGSASQTRELRGTGQFRAQPASPGEQALAIVEAADDSSFQSAVRRLAELTALAHLRTTLRKMGAGQKCSLRFFTDGPRLRATGLTMLPGHSNDRLTNVLRVLADLGVLQRGPLGYRVP
jgi:hypothetical protein